MTAFLLSFGWNWLLVPVAVWFARGVWAAFAKPKLVYLQHTKVGSNSYLVTVHRQEIMPPWRELTETWHVIDSPSDHDYVSTREGDGRTVNWDGWLHSRLRGVLRVALLRDKETEELSK